MLQRLSLDQVRLGMFIHAFEGTWLQNPFWRRSFLLKKPEDLATLRASEITSVIIDTERGLGARPQDGQQAGLKQVRSASSSHPPPFMQRPKASRRQPGRTSETAQARIAATNVVTRSQQAVVDIFEGARLGKLVESEAVKATVEEVSSAVAKNRHALFNVLRLKSKDAYTYLHSISVCALMINFARHLDLSEEEVRNLGIAGLMHDLGKMTLSPTILQKPGCLDDDEILHVRSHPEQGYLMLMDAGLPAVVMDVVRHHHEKFDGTGYPSRLAGETISAAARMGAICDVYDALTSDRPYKDAWTPVEAITKMKSWSGHFDPDLLFAFMQSIEVFPVGMLVQLRSNRLGIVQANGRRASRPRVLAFYSTRDQAFLDQEIVVVGETLATDAVIAEADPVDWGIELGCEGLMLINRPSSKQTPKRL